MLYGNEDFVVYLGNSGDYADDALMGSTAHVLTLQGARARDHLTVTRTFFPPDNFNLLFIGLVVHGPSAVTIDVDSVQDPYSEKVSSSAFSLFTNCPMRH